MTTNVRTLSTAEMDQVLAGTGLAAALEAAILAYPADYRGTWEVQEDDDTVRLVWECEADATGDMYGDEPWTQWGGHQIIATAKAPRFIDSGSDCYTDKYGDDMVCQWVEWKV